MSHGLYPTHWQDPNFALTLTIGRVTAGPGLENTSLMFGHLTMSRSLSTAPSPFYFSPSLFPPLSLVFCVCNSE